MSKLIPVYLSIAVCGLLFSQPAQSAVVEVDVTIKSVDAKARGITVVYEAKTGQKSIDLDVSRKAAITVNGSDGTLDTLRPGQKAKVAFEKELQVVTKIDATGNKTASAQAVFRLMLSVSEVGDCELTIEQTAKPVAAVSMFMGEAMSLARLPKAKAWRDSDGRIRIIHSFDDADDVTRIFSKVDQAELDPRTGMLTFKPSKSGPGSAWYRYSAQPPFMVCYDRPLAQSKSSIVMECVSLNMNGSLTVGLAKAEASEGHAKIDVLWRDMENGQFKKPTQLLTQKDIDPKVGCHATFRLPLPNARITNHFMMTFAGFSSEGEDAQLVHLLVQGRLSGGFGIVYGKQGPFVFSKKVIPGGPAAKAGVQEGDIIASINKEKPQSVEDAARLMRSVTIGDEVHLAIRRGEQEHEIKFVAE